MNDKMKAKCYRLDYNELGLSTLCVEKDKEIQRLKEEYIILQNASDEVEEEKDREIERLNNIINKAIEFMNYTFNISSVKEMYEIMNKLEEILQGSDKE